MLMEVMVIMIAAALGILIFHAMLFRGRRKECAEYMNLALDFFEADHRFLAFKDEEKRYFMVNRAFLLLHGKEKEDFIGKTDGELQRKDLAETLEKNKFLKDVKFLIIKKNCDIITLIQSIILM